mmetsp:Transcript_34419/g.52825  ORF Transcript_34419/g.52825 Transcript_34419/m.52825 type:complete len:301 (-) Transcript_34419:828-1730(-)
MAKTETLVAPTNISQKMLSLSSSAAAAVRKSSHIQTLLPSSSPPRAVVIILGHLGASPEKLNHYAEKLYLRNNCAVVTAASPPSRFMLNKSLQPTVLVALQDATQVLETTPPSTPLVVHLFSNGGAFLLEEMIRLLKQDDSSKFDLCAARHKIGFQFFDSCPCFVRPAWNFDGLTSAFPHPTFSVVGRTMYALAASWSLTVWCTLTLSLHRPMRFWNTVLHENDVCRNHVYAYTTTDLATDAHQVDKLIKHLREELSYDITTFRYEDSNHCRLLHDHEQEYTKAVDDALEAAIQRGSQST